MDNIFLIIDEYGYPKQASRLDSGDLAVAATGHIEIFRFNQETRNFEHLVSKDSWMVVEHYINTLDVDPTVD